jgi:hypothetical protein
MEFRIDRSGKPVSITTVQAEAGHILQDAALRLIGGTTFDVTSPQFDVANPTAFRITIKFCLPNCAGISTLPDSEEMTISGRPMPPFKGLIR